MMAPFVLSIKEANLLRARMRLVLRLHERLLLQPDAKTVHDLRVASRRLREALDFLEPLLPPAAFKKVRTRAREFTKNLGTTRELEVNLKLLRSLVQEKTTDPGALEFLLYSQKKQLEKSQSQLIKRISRNPYAIFGKFILRIKGSRAHDPGSPDLLEKRVLEFNAFDVGPQTSDERLHELRITTKKLRYSFEIYDRIFEKNLNSLVKDFKSFQDLLGEIHDLYVLHGLTMDKIRKAQKRNLRHIPSALRHVADRLQKEKEKRKLAVPAIYTALREQITAFQATAPVSTGPEPETKPFDVEWLEIATKGVNVRQ
jgi:CHAD domain-containing protein